MDDKNGTRSLRIAEYDEAGTLKATYVQTSNSSEQLSRIDVIPPENSKSLWQQGLDIFLPAGYPNSVTKDYLEYQIYDSLQAFSSSIASLLSSRAVLSSVGVGDSTASPTAALLLSIWQESAGRIATILFAHRFGTSLEPECKMYRLLADVLNDTAFVLDCLSPVFPKSVRWVVLSVSSVMRALCGVAAGSAKASLSAHFARWGNLGELNAKDSSQETVISLLGMLTGGVVVSWITSSMATWTTLILLLSIHLETNRRAVRAVSMRTLNRQRATLLFHSLRRGHVPSPEEISTQEYIFERDGVLRAGDGTILGHCAVGAPFSSFLGGIAKQHATTKSLRSEDQLMARILSLYTKKPYITWFSQKSKGHRRHFQIVLKQDIDNRSILEAWWQVLTLALVLKETSTASKSENDSETALKFFQEAEISATALLQKYQDRLTEAGWELDSGALTTVSATRVSLEI